MTLISIPEEKRGNKVIAAKPVGVKMLKVGPGSILELKNLMEIAMVKLQNEIITE